MLALLGVQHLQRLVVERDAQVFARFGLVGVDPRYPALQVDLLPAEQPHVGFAQPGGQAQCGHGAQVGRQLGQQLARFVGREPGHALDRLMHLRDRRHALKPAALVREMQDLAHLSQMPVHRGIAGGVILRDLDGLALFGQIADQVAVDADQRLAVNVGGEPVQAQLDVFDAAQVIVLLQPGQHGLTPGQRGGFAESFLPPEIARKGRGPFLRCRSLRGARASLNALSIDREVNPEDAAGAAGVDAHGSSPWMYWVRSQSMTSASTSTKARPTLAAGRPLRWMQSDTVSAVVLSTAAASSRLRVVGILRTQTLRDRQRIARPIA
ncbi:MAG: hypothetical protein ABI605_11090 [Rhizobacter sp.]